ncbi:MAG: LUD domain-containing protein [Verrucomicrobia bacterium]|nr:LUD domain-containing protein [Verrucomicrobiota bacterium]
MNARANILDRIRSALRKESRRPEPPTPGTPFSPIAPADLIPRFERELLALKAEFHRAANWGDAHSWVKHIADRDELRRIAAAPDADAAEAGQAVQARMLTGAGDCGKSLANVDLGISGCECVVARTGSVVLTSQSGFGRALSVLPPAHIVVARRSQLVADLNDAYRLLQTRHSKLWPSMITIITGPSRTADIEKILVLGAHGPRKLFVLLLDF